MKEIAKKLFYTGAIQFGGLTVFAILVPVTSLYLLQVLLPEYLPVIIAYFFKFSVAIVLISWIVYMVTHHASVHKSLDPMQKKIEIGELAVRVAHDLKGPLSGVQTVRDQLAEGCIHDPKLGPLCDLLELSGGRIASIADGLLKEYKGEKELPTAFNLHELLDRLIGEHQAQPVLDSIEFPKDYVQQPIAVFGKKSLIERMFANIIKNAIEAIGFSGTIRTRTRIFGRSVAVGIHNSGPGLSQEKIDRILNETGYTAGKKQGHGIGLTLVKEVVQDHKGKLDIYSPPQSGCCFEISLPLHTVQTAGSRFTLRADRHVLVIDDDPSLRESWGMILAAKGLKVTTAKSFEDLLEKEASAGNPETTTAIVDFHFENSVTDGLAIIDYLRSKGWKHLVLCTAEYWKPQIHAKLDPMGIPVCPKPIPNIVVVKPEQGIVAEPVLSKAKDLLPRKDGPGPRVLVVDDDPAILMSWELIREKLGISELRTCANLESLTATGTDLSQFDIAFLDKNIAGSAFSGAEVLPYLRKKGIPKIIIASGENISVLRANPLFQEADGFTSDKIPSDLSAFLGK